jgi:DNA-binding Xre family transcriptional regulator
VAISWRLKTYLATRHGIYGAVSLQQRVVKKTGVLISVQNLCNFLEKKPKMIRLQTIEILVTALECKLEDFCKITPTELKNPSSPRKLSYQNTPLSKRGMKSFPDPEDYHE